MINPAGPKGPALGYRKHPKMGTNELASIIVIIACYASAAWYAYTSRKDNER